MYDVIIIGAGPAGLMCSAQLSEKLNTLIIEKKDTAANKLLLTAGGRCNLTNNKENKPFLEEISHNKKYLYSTIHSFGPKEVMEFFSEHIELKEEEDNKMFPKSNKAKDVLKVLMKKQHGMIHYEEEVKEIKVLEKGFKVITNKRVYDTNNVVVASGGSSFKKTGSTGDHMKFAKQLNQPVIPLYPAETSIILEAIHDIAGVSFEDVVIKAKKHKASGHLMYTHKGLSGSAVMKISEHIHLENIKEIRVDFLVDKSVEDILNFFEANRESQINTVVAKLTTKRFASHLVKLAEIDEAILVKQLDPKQHLKIADLLKDHIFKVTGSSPLETAYVSGGGIDVKKIDTKTFESKIHRDLYFIGECLDFHGPIGGYNITLALSTGHSAAQSILNK